MGKILQKMEKALIFSGKATKSYEIDVTFLHSNSKRSNVKKEHLSKMRKCYHGHHPGHWQQVDPGDESLICCSSPSRGRQKLDSTLILCVLRPGCKAASRSPLMSECAGHFRFDL